jgi:glycosyltransferase involved in cell wall biosynthesis
MNAQNNIRTTVVVVPRESFNMFDEVVKRIYDVTPPIFKMIIMEGKSPEPVREKLRQFAKTRPNCQIVWSDKWLYPHEYVNQAIPLIDTDYAVFVDNDVEVMDGWLEALVKCADEEKAGCVHPIYLTVKLNDPSLKIHIAEGTLVREMKDGQWLIDTIATYSGVSLKDYPDQIRKPSGFFEWHTVLFSKKLLDKVGPLNDLNIAEHLDYTMRIEKAGEKVILEPKAVVAYNYERIFELDEVSKRYFLFRWNVEKSTASLEKLRANWNLHPLSTARRLHWVKEHSTKIKHSLLGPRIVNKIRRTLGMPNMPFSKEPAPSIPEIEALQRKAAVRKPQAANAAN